MTDCSKIQKGMHLKLTPIDKLPNMDRDVIVNEIILDKWTGEQQILYGLSSTCDGYTIPFSWIKKFDIIA